MSKWTGWPRLRFVDAAEVSANVRYDLNSGPSAPLADGWSMGVPSLDGDPDALGVEWGRRTLSFTQRVYGEREDALSHLNRLRRELYRRRNWLLVQLGPSSAPVWLRTYRSASGALDFEHVYNDDRPDYWTLGMEIAADAWAVGETVSFGLEYSLNPFAGTDRLGVWLPPIQGEVATPLRVTQYGMRPTLVYGTARDGFFAASPVPAQTASAAPYWTYAAAGTGTVRKGAAPSSVLPGRYRVVVAHQGAAGGSHRWGISVDGGTTAVWTTATAVTSWRTLTAISSTTYVWYDLGEVTIRSATGAAVTPYVWHTWTGTSAAQVATMLIPITQDEVGEQAQVMAMVSAPTAYGSPLRDRIVIDDSDDHDHHVLRDDYALPTTPAGASRLLAYPQYENRLTLLGRLDADGSSLATPMVDVSYRPRYTDLAGGL